MKPSGSKFSAVLAPPLLKRMGLTSTGLDALDADEAVGKHDGLGSASSAFSPPATSLRSGAVRGGPAGGANAAAGTAVVGRKAGTSSAMATAAERRRGGESLLMMAMPGAKHI